MEFTKHNQREINRKQFNQIDCFYCNKKGHHIRYCPFKNETYDLKQNEKLDWLLKERLINYTNMSGSNSYWMPFSQHNFVL